MKIFQIKIALFFALMTFISCTLDNMYLYPDKLDNNLKEIFTESYKTGEIIVIKFDEKYNPLFYNDNNERIFTDVEVQSIFFENENRDKLHAWYLTPRNDYNGINLLFLHGNARNILSHYQIAMPLAQSGFKVFLIDYSGFGLSQGKATRENVRIDANSALNYMHQELIKKTDKIFIYGQSLGGHLAAVIGAENKTSVDGLIIEGAFSSHKDIGAHFIALGFFARIFVKEMYSAKDSIKNFNKPVLIIHSTEDEVVPFFMGKKLYKNANFPKEFFEIEKRHILGPIYYTEEITERILKMRDL